MVTVSCRPPMRQRAEGWSNESTRLRVCGGSGGDKKVIEGGLEVAPQLAGGAPETGASERGGEEGGRFVS